MTDTKGNIRARKLGNTGITEDLLRKIADKKGGHLLAVVELKADTIHEQVTGDDRIVDFIIDTIEPVVDGNLNGQLVEHVRDIAAALHRNRMLAENGPQLPIDGDGPEPTVKDVLAQGQGLLDLDTNDAADEAEPDDDSDADPEPAEPENPAYEPHTYIDTAHATCGYMGCGQPAGATIHDDPEPEAA